MPTADRPRFERADALHRLGNTDFDLLVVGGGITGAGVALDAASRGLRTALVERHDFASGTSSRSSKLVHGGLRYLDQHEFRLVYEGLAERQRMLENAPHLVRVLPFLVPILTSGGRVDRRLAPVLGSALWMYDLTGGLRIGKRHHRVRVDDALARFPTLNRDRLAGAYLYYDAHADDARLTLAIARTAVAHGAVALNYAEVVSFERHGSRVVGARIRAGHDELTVRARAVVNATGVWGDDVRALDEGVHPASIRPAKGVHITVPWELVRNDVAAIVPSARDDRSVFVIPWDGHTYVGTTDTEYDGSLDDPQCTETDAAYLLDALNGITNVGAEPADIVGSWAGLRPLLATARRARTADLSRRHAVRVAPSGVVTVTGGKLTTYRRMAADAVDAAVRVLGDTGSPFRHGAGAQSATRHLRLFGGDGIEPGAAGVDHLTGRYGTESAAVRALVDADPALGEPLVRGLAYLRAEAVYAVRHEMALTLDDVLARRTRARVLSRSASADAAPAVAELLAPELGWSDSEREREVCAYTQAVAAELV
ncbi:MAG: glycerol-3-phosphate dehydrogenase/oxidase [Acidimicrobiia bacterium]